ncbi:MAG: hypothetical protein WBV90_18610, partial [Terrimicrobiaceae bacterium]
MKQIKGKPLPTSSPDLIGEFTFNNLVLFYPSGRMSKVWIMWEPSNGSLSYWMIHASNVNATAYSQTGCSDLASAPELSPSGARAAATSPPAFANKLCPFSNSYPISLLLNLTHTTLLVMECESFASQPASATGFEEKNVMRALAKMGCHALLREIGRAKLHILTALSVLLASFLKPWFDPRESY